MVRFGGGISKFSLAAGQGTLTALPGSPYSTGGDASNTIAASSDGRAIVVDNQSQSTTASLAIQPDGSLVLAGTPQAAGYNPRWVTIDPTSEFVYTSSNSSSVVAAYRLDPVSLALEVVPGALWQTGSNPYALTVLAGSQAPYCPLNGVEPSVTICAPATSSPSPMRIVAGATSASAMKSMTVLVDGAKTFSNTASEAMDVFLDLPSGPHTLTVQAQNSRGQRFSLARNITVSGSGSSSCSNRGILPTVSICTPLAGSQTGNSIHLTAQSVGVNVISATAVYLDGNEVYSVSGGAVNTYISVAKGSHRITVQSTDTDGRTWGSTVYVRTP